MEFSETSKMILDSNFITNENLPSFIRDLRLTLRLDYGMNATVVRKLKDNEIIEKWYEFNSKPENRIGGSE